MAEHTPGPWLFNADEDIHKTPGGNYVTCGGYATICCVDERSDGDIDANAHLIAAAPTLLEELETTAIALEMCLEHIQEQATGPGHLGMVERFTKKLTSARAAVAKAKGESA